MSFRLLLLDDRMKQKRIYLLQLWVAFQLLSFPNRRERCTEDLETSWLPMLKGIGWAEGALDCASNDEKAEQSQGDLLEGCSTVEEVAGAGAAALAIPEKEEEQQQQECREADTEGVSREQRSPIPSSSKGVMFLFSLTDDEAADRKAETQSTSGASDSTDGDTLTSAESSSESSPQVQRASNKSKKAVPKQVPREKLADEAEAMGEDFSEELEENKEHALRMRKLIDSLSKKSPIGYKWFKKAKPPSAASPLLTRSLQAFLPSVPVRRSGFRVPRVPFSTGAAQVVDFVQAHFPKKVKSILDGCAMSFVSINWSLEPMYSAGGITFYADVGENENTLPYFLTVFFVENTEGLGLETQRALQRVTELQRVTVRANLRRATDLPVQCRIAGPSKLLTLSHQATFNLKSTVVVGKAVLEPRLWAPSRKVLNAANQSQGLADLKRAHQTRLSLTQQYVEVVSAIRARHIVLPRVTPDDFWVDSQGVVFYNSAHQLLFESDLEQPSSSGEGLTGEGAFRPATTAAAARQAVQYDETANSVELALLLMEVWCKLTAEQQRARTPERAAAIRQTTLDFSTCLPLVPPEVKELITLLQGGIGRPSIPAAKAVLSGPFITLGIRLRGEEKLEIQAQEKRQAAIQSAEAASSSDSSGLTPLKAGRSKTLGRSAGKSTQKRKTWYWGREDDS